MDILSSVVLSGIIILVAGASYILLRRTKRFSYESTTISPTPKESCQNIRTGYKPGDKILESIEFTLNKPICNCYKLTGEHEIVWYIRPSLDSSYELVFQCAECMYEIGVSEDKIIAVINIKNGDRNHLSDVTEVSLPDNVIPFKDFN